MNIFGERALPDGLPVRSLGFTLVELVMVIILIGVLSALGVGLFARSSTFSPLLATQQLESATLLAQQAALAGSPDRFLTIELEDGEFVLSVWDDNDDNDASHQFAIPANGTSIWVNGASLPTTIEFDHFGAPSDKNAREIVVSGESEFTVCVGSLGAVYRGSC